MRLLSCMSDLTWTNRKELGVRKEVLGKAGEEMSISVEDTQ